MVTFQGGLNSKGRGSLEPADFPKLEVGTDKTAPALGLSWAAHPVKDQPGRAGFTPPGSHQQAGAPVTWPGVLIRLI